MLACVKSVLESVDFLHLRNAFTCFVSTDLYCDLNNKFKQRYYVISLVQGIQAFAFSTARDDGTTSVFQISFNSQCSYVSPISKGSYGTTVTTFYNIKAKNLPN